MLLLVVSVGAKLTVNNNHKTFCIWLINNFSNHLVSELEGLQKKNVLPGFEDQSSDELSMDRLTDEITAVKNNNIRMYFLIIPCLFSLLPILQLFHSCQRKVKRINAESQQSSRSQQNAVLSKNIQTSLATKLQELSGSFRKTQSKYLQSMSFIGGRDYTFSYAHPFRTPRSGSQKQTHVYIKCW